VRLASRAGVRFNSRMTHPADSAPADEADDTDPQTPADTCPHCLKPKTICVCDGIVPIDNRIALLILQHPQEQSQDLGTARLVVRHLTNAEFRIGLSWPSLSKILDRPADPKRWAVLYLGSMQPEDFPPGREIAVLDRKGQPVADQDAALAGIEGVVVLDGTWSQAKTLWWRNAWMLKGQRIALKPRHPSLYGKLRREPRREALSTLESAALLLSRLEQRPEIETALLGTFARMLERYREARGTGAHKAGPGGGSRPKGPGRPRRPGARRPGPRR
jgi:DTW domain-containing protein YfiP